MKATGVHSAFIEHIELLREKNDVQVVVNDEGTGDVFHGHTYGFMLLFRPGPQTLLQQTYRILCSIRLVYS